MLAESQNSKETAHRGTECRAHIKLGRQSRFWMGELNAHGYCCVFSLKNFIVSSFFILRYSFFLSSFYFISVHHVAHIKWVFVGILQAAAIFPPVFGDIAILSVEQFQNVIAIAICDCFDMVARRAASS